MNALIGSMRINFFFAVLLLFIADCAEESDTASQSQTSSTASPVVMQATITKEQAIALVSELPEIKVWSGYIERITKYEVRPAIMVLPEEPVINNGKQYWSVGFYEEQPTNVHRWETFLVGLDGKEILIDDIEDGAISLREWRNRKKTAGMIGEG